MGSAGASFGTISFGIALSIIPALAGIWMLSSDEQNPLAEAVLVFGWTLLAMLAVAASGGPRSAAIILFAIGPITAYVVGDVRLTIESTVFAAIGYLGSAALGSFGFTPAIGEVQSTLGGAAAAMGIAQILMLIWSELPVQNEKVAPTSDPLQLNAVKTKVDIETKKRLRQHNAYFASLSHDLRSPFTAILGYAESFKMNPKGNLTDKQVDQASIIHESAQDLLSLVDDMMDLAKTDAGKMPLDPEPIHLGDLGDAIMRQMQAMADRKNITLKIDTFGEPWAMADARLVRRIWQNLISNAIKYSDPDSLVQMSASERARHVVLSVKDNGRGMTPEDLDRIASPYTMGENSKDKAGTGLGLVNVKRFAEMHGGRVIIDTAPGQGSRFQVILPKADISNLAPL